MSEPGDDPVEVPLTDALDLHDFQPRDVKDLVTHYLDEAQAKGYREVRVIHGRGVGVQREIVRSILARHPKVVSYADAPPERGGWGATIVRLAEPPVDV